MYMEMEGKGKAALESKGNAWILNSSRSEGHTQLAANLLRSTV